MKVMEDEEKRRLQQAAETYRSDLLSQVKQGQRLQLQQRAQEEREHQQGLVQQLEYQRKKDHFLSRPASHTPGTAVHPFRQADRSRSAPRPPPHQAP
ncbi:cilia- and flagella-associated protein 53-like [Etheostoma cragini]|uniref:cilia- and flagella-associated protein 53-like n=1 Tax=Etheostoma cragini TaxID=417921 RepID=UPI00155DE5DC|nr:cilia- and flagella-associated protein 53-like [Etheostoma cragini]